MNTFLNILYWTELLWRILPVYSCALIPLHEMTVNTFVSRGTVLKGLSVSFLSSLLITPILLYSAFYLKHLIWFRLLIKALVRFKNYLNRQKHPRLSEYIVTKFTAWSHFHFTTWNFSSLDLHFLGPSIFPRLNCVHSYCEIVLPCGLSKIYKVRLFLFIFSICHTCALLFKNEI